MRTFRCHVAVLALSVAVMGTTAVTNLRPSGQSAVHTPYASRLMADGQQWMTENLNVEADGSYCYDDEERNCRQYGRLYTWDSAQRACSSLSGGWRLPTDDEWRRLARRYGGISGDAADGGTAAYQALVIGGRSGFDARLGGGRSPDGREYARLDAHGFYWTASESGPAIAPFYNFARGGSALYRQPAGEKQRAFSVRCMRNAD